MLLLSIFASLLAGVQGYGAYYILDFEDVTYTSVAEAVVSISNTSTLAAAVGPDGPYSAVGDVLADPTGNFTLFAPTDDAFGALLASAGIDAATFLADPGTLQAILAHAVGEAYSDRNLTDLAFPQTPLPTLAEYRFLTVTDQSTFFEVNAGSGVSAKIISAYKCGNGFVYIVDAVLVPANNPSIDEITAWDPSLSLINTLTANTLAPNSTLFAPTDDAIVELITFFNLTVEEFLLDATRLTDILEYHVMVGSQYSGDVLAAETLVTAGGLSLTPKVEEDGSVTLMDVSGAKATLLMVDIKAFNGVVHKIDKVLIPYKPLLTTLTEAGIYGTFLGLATAAGFADVLAEPMMPYTLLAVNDTVFEALNITVEGLSQQLGFENHVGLHVIQGYVQQSFLNDAREWPTANPQMYPVTMLPTGPILDLDSYSSSAPYSPSTGDQFMYASDGGYYDVSTVLIAPDTIYTILPMIPSLSFMFGALQLYGIAPELNTGMPYTLLAPTNATFDATLAALGLTEEQVLAGAIPTLDDTLMYHVILGKYTFSQLAAMDGMMVDTLEGQQLSVVFIAGVEGGKNPTEDQIILTDVNGGSVTLTSSDFTELFNGVIVEIDAILFPKLSIAELLEDASQMGRYSILTSALAQTGLSVALDQQLSEAGLTLLAPSDDAFAALLTELDITAEQLLAMENLADFLLYHVLPFEANSTFILTAPGNETFILSTLASTNISIDVNATTPSITFTDNYSPSRTSMVNLEMNGTYIDQFASNGVIHEVDTVVLPYPNIAAIASSLPAFSILVEALVKAELVDVFATEGNTYTVFAPTDDAFAALLTELDVTKEQLLDLPDLADILTYHVLDAYVLEAVAVNVSSTGPTLQGDAIALNVTGEGTLVLTDGRGRMANVIGSDVKATNGVIHAIDKVILPATTSPTESPTDMPTGAPTGSPTENESSACRLTLSALTLFSIFLAFSG